MNARESNPDQVPANQDWGSPKQVHTLVLLAAVAAGVWIGYRLAKPFLPGLVWAMALAILFNPFHEWIEVKVRRPSLAAIISVLAIGLIVLVPAVLVGQRLVLEAAKGAEPIQAKFESGNWRCAIEAHPRVARVLFSIERKMDLPGTVTTLTHWPADATAAVIRGSVVQLIEFGLTLYLLFYFLRDRNLALQAIRSLSPLADSDTNRLLARVSDTVHATIYGTLAVSAVQGVLGGVDFWLLGLPGPLLWGLVMALLAVLPVSGAFLVWIPASLFLALEGSWGKALVLAGWNAIIAGGIHNALYPILVGRRLHLHTVLAFIALVGGLMLFGPVGIILGPVGLACATLLMEIRRDQFKTNPAPLTSTAAAAEDHLPNQMESVPRASD